MFARERVLRASIYYQLPSTIATALFRLFRRPSLSSVFICLIIGCMAATGVIHLINLGFLVKIGEIEVASKISGDVYHSEKVFQMDYGEMERKFKIYVYPDEHDHHEIANTISGKYASEGYFFKNIRESVFLTDEPDHAHLFLIPISCHKLHQKVSSYKKMTSIVAKYVKGLILSYPYWNRSLGSDHIFLTCHDIDVGATEQVSFLVKNSIRVVCSPSYSAVGFIPHKDVSLPLVMQPFAGVNDVHNKRTILGYWAGVCSSETRKKLVNLWGQDDELDIQNSTAHNAGRMKKFYSSKFCICPVGSRITSSRITMAIHYGCVPVILADYFDLPFNDILDWRKFSVIVSESDVHKLKNILKEKAGAEYRMLHSNLLKVQRHFKWNTHPVKYDTFHMVLYDLWLRRNIVKY